VVEVALATLRETFRANGIPLRERVDYTRVVDADGRVGLQPHQRHVVDLDVLGIPLHALMESLSEVEDLLKCVAGHDALHGMISAFTGEFIEDVESQRRFLVQWTLGPFMRYYLRTRADANWDQAAFSHILSDLVWHLDGNQLPIEELTPLDNFKSEVEFIELDATISVVALSDEELSDIWDTWGPRDMWGSGLVTMDKLLDWSHAIKHQMLHRFPSLGEEVTQDRPMQDALTALRLVRGSSVGAAFTWRRFKRFAFAQAALEHLSPSAPASRLGWVDPFEVTTVDVSTIKALFAQLRASVPFGSVQARRFSLALRRLNASVERFSIEDRLIDYWVALETLFASDSRGEIRHRARTRIARYLETDLEARRACAKTLGDSYSRRSEIIHGDTPKPNMADLTRDTGDILRRALRRMLETGIILDVDELDLG
jgi:hypothetical protein